MEVEIIFLYFFVPLFFILLVLVLSKIIFFSKSKSKVILAEIEKIEPIFIKENKFLEPYLSILCKFNVKKKEYKNLHRIPFSELLQLQGDMELYFNKDIELPVLRVQQEYYIGSESIEHKLLQILSFLPIRYLIFDPKRSFVLPLNKKYFLSKK